MRVSIVVDLDPCVCSGCGLEAPPVPHQLEKRFDPAYAAPRWKVHGWTLPDGWDDLRFGTVRGVLCPACGARIAAAVMPLLDPAGGSSGEGGGR